jgi:peptidoglycan/LPS O-acetylase OafA/YrhL
MGAFRLFLAFVVVLVHGGIERQLDFPFLSTVSAVHAVRMFFVVSGFYMALVIDTKYSRLQNGTQMFYANRLLRLLPSYWLVAFAFIAGSYLVHPQGLTQNVGWWRRYDELFSGYDVAFLYIVVTNIFLVGQDFAAFIHVNRGLGAHEFLIVPQAWSLGTELWFYFAAPLLVTLSSRTLLILIAFGALVRLVVDLAGLAWPWDQRLIITEYVFFLAGILSYRAMRTDRSTWSTSPTIGAAVLVLMPFVVFYIGWLELGREVDVVNSLLFGLIAALMIPALFNLTKRSKIDRLAGDFSYAVYLTHLPILYLYPALKNYPIWILPIVVFVSSLLVFFVERPIDAWRERQTKRMARPSAAQLGE